MTSDLRFAARMIFNHRWFSAAIVAALALGIGVNTTVFSLVNAVLFKPLAMPGGDRLVVVSSNNPSQDRDRMSVSYPDFLELRSRATTFEALEAGRFEGAVISEEGNPPQQYKVGRITPGMFEMVRAEPVLGRRITPEDSVRGAAPVVLLRYGVWMDRYGGSPAAVGRSVRVNGNPAEVIGVMPEGFEFPAGQDFWMPLVPTEQLEDRDQRPLALFGILKRGATVAEANADLEVIAQGLASAYPDANEGVGAIVQTFHQRYNGGQIRMVFFLMLGAVGFVLLIACANVANMMLSRALGRRREVFIRAAMGASRWRIVRQLLVESVLLSFAGGVLGLALTVVGTRAFDLAVSNVGKPYWIDFSIDYVVFGYFAAVCLLSGLLFGLAPALQISRLDLNSALKDGTRTAGSVRGGRLSGGLVVLQFALAVVLLSGAGLFLRGFMAHQAVNAWLPSDSLLTAGLTLPEDRYPSADARTQFYGQLLPRLQALPGVDQAAVVSSPPGSGAGTRPFEIDGSTVSEEAQRPRASVLAQSPGYLRLIDLPILAGRDFEQTDGMAGREAAIVTREFAARFWPGEQALGKRLRFHNDEGPGEWITVVGVCGNIVQYMDNDQRRLLLVPYRQEGSTFMSLMVRTTGAPMAAAAAIRAEVQMLDRDLPLSEVRTMDELRHRQRWYLRVFGSVFFIFAAIALLLASIGIYAVMAQSTGRRTQEIGVRMALGATAGDILRLVMARGLKQLGIGLGVGIAGAFAANQLLSSLLYGVSPGDPVVLTGVALVLVAAGLLASWLPARRAAALHPVRALRYE